MSHRFFRCRLCGMPHEQGTRVCPLTGQAVPASRSQHAMQTGKPAGTKTSAKAATKGPPPLPVTKQRSDPPPPPPAAWIGRVIDQRYKIEGVLAQGGMGVVFQATHLAMQRAVALKALSRRHVEDPVAIARFRNEARLAGSLGHPNIVEVHDMGTLDDGSPYLVMEMLAGETLAAYMKRKNMLPLRTVTWIVDQILSALAATHARGVVHRDLKPDNVFLATRADTNTRSVKLLDFGISKAVRLPREEEGDEADLTRMGFIMGTPMYMAPEQARGDRDLDERVDVWAVGVLCYQMLLARLPYTARSLAELVGEMKRKRVQAVRSVRTDVPEEVGAVIEKLMAQGRERRYRNADEALGAWRAATQADEKRLDTHTSAHKAAEPADEDAPTQVFAPQAIQRGTDADTSQRVQVFSLPVKPPRPS